MFTIKFFYVMMLSLKNNQDWNKMSQNIIVTVLGNSAMTFSPSIFHVSIFFTYLCWLQITVIIGEVSMFLTLAE